MESNKNIKLKKALHKVEEIKKFYKHLVAFVLINLVLTFFWSFSFKVFGGFIISNKFDENGFLHYPLWFIWGIILVLHALKIFGFPFLFDDNWEERKIKEAMDKEA
jgi:hypothetical protein